MMHYISHHHIIFPICSIIAIMSNPAKNGIVAYATPLKPSSKGFFPLKVWCSSCLAYLSPPLLPFHVAHHRSDDKCGVSSFDRALMDRMDLEKQPLFIIIITIIIVSYHHWMIEWSIMRKPFHYDATIKLICLCCRCPPMHHAPRISKTLQTHHEPLGVGHPKSW